MMWHFDLVAPEQAEWSLPLSFDITHRYIDFGFEHNTHIFHMTFFAGRNILSIAIISLYRSMHNCGDGTLSTLTPCRAEFISEGMDQWWPRLLIQIWSIYLNASYIIYIMTKTKYVFPVAFSIYIVLLLYIIYHIYIYMHTCLPVYNI